MVIFHIDTSAIFRPDNACSRSSFAMSLLGQIPAADPSIADHKGYTKGKLSQQHAFANLDGSPDYP